MRIGILQTGLAPADLAARTGDYPHLFATLLAGHGFTFSSWHVEAGIFPPDVHAADGWLITGSRHGAYEDHAFIPPLEDFIRTAYAAAVPMIGVCFGHQIIAQAMGGKVEKFTGGWTVGPQAYDFAGEPVTLHAWHQDQVTKKPAAAQVLATAEYCENAALVYGNRVFTVQAHPEFQDDFVSGLITTRGPGVVPDPLLRDASARLGASIDTATLADKMAAFFKQPRD